MAGAGDLAHLDRPADGEEVRQHVLERGDVGLDGQRRRIDQRDVVDVEGRGGGGGRLHVEGEEVHVRGHGEQGGHSYPLTRADERVGDDGREVGRAGQPALDADAQVRVRLARRQLGPHRRPVAEAARHLAQYVEGGSVPDRGAAGGAQAARAPVRLFGHVGQHGAAAPAPVAVAAVLGGEAEEAVVAVGLEVAGEAGLVRKTSVDTEVVDVVLRAGAAALDVQDQLADVGAQQVAALEGDPARAGHAVGGAGGHRVEAVGRLTHDAALDGHAQRVLRGRLPGGEPDRHAQAVHAVLLDGRQDVQARPVPVRGAARRLQAAEPGGGRLAGHGQHRASAWHPSLRGAVLEVVVHGLRAGRSRRGERRQRASASAAPERYADGAERLPHVGPPD